MKGRYLPLIVGIWFQVLFHSPPGVLFTFPSRYWFTIGHERVFCLPRWSSGIPTGFLVSRGTWVLPPRGLALFAYRTFTFSGWPFQDPSTKNEFFYLSTPSRLESEGVPLPQPHNASRLDMGSGLGSSHFAHHYSGNRFCLLFLQVLRWFTSLGLLSAIGGMSHYEA